jgi:hypothetical protein
MSRLGTVRTVAVLTREEFDAIEFDAAASGDYESAARRMSKLALTGTQTASMPRSEAYLRAGEQWLLADDPATAASGFRLAMADGGPVFTEPRVLLARALFQLGRHDEAQALIEKLKATGRTDPRTCDLVAELLVERLDLTGALDWATAGVEVCLARVQAVPGQAMPGQAVPEDQGSRPAGRPEALRDAANDGAELRMLLSLRYRIRNDLGLAEDSYDKLLDER